MSTDLHSSYCYYETGLTHDPVGPIISASPTVFTKITLSVCSSSGFQWNQDLFVSKYHQRGGVVVDDEGNRIGSVDSDDLSCHQTTTVEVVDLDEVSDADDDDNDNNDDDEWGVFIFE